MNERLEYFFFVKKHPVVFGSMTNSRESKCLYFTQTYNVDVIRFCKASQRKLRTMLWYKESLMVLYCIMGGWFEAGQSGCWQKWFCEMLCYCQFGFSLTYINIKRRGFDIYKRRKGTFGFVRGGVVVALTKNRQFCRILENFQMKFQKGHFIVHK